MDVQCLYGVISRLATVDIVSPVPFTTQYSNLADSEYASLAFGTWVLGMQNIVTTLSRHIFCIVADRLEFLVLQKGSRQHRDAASTCLDELPVVFTANKIRIGPQ